MLICMQSCRRISHNLPETAHYWLVLININCGCVCVFVFTFYQYPLCNDIRHSAKLLLLQSQLGFIFIFIISFTHYVILLIHLWSVKSISIERWIQYVPVVEKIVILWTIPTGLDTKNLAKKKLSLLKELLQVLFQTFLNLQIVKENFQNLNNQVSNFVMPITINLLKYWHF